MNERHKGILLALVGWLAFHATSAWAADVPKLACYAGAYRLQDGRRFVIQPLDEDVLRYRFMDGHSGRLFPTGKGNFESGPGWSGRKPVILRASLGDCSAHSFTWHDQSGPVLTGNRITQRVVPFTVAARDVSLYGELHLPEKDKPRAVVILHYGSGGDAATVYNFVQHLLPLDGIAVVVFDKRGTGRSTGSLTAHIGQLADDMVPVVEKVRQMPEVQGLPLGLMGESQGGWVVPLVATKTPVDFVVVSYGLAISMAEEDHQEMLQGLEWRHAGPDEIARAEAVRKITHKIVVSHLTEGIDELERLKAAHGNEAWFKALRGDFTDALTHTPPDKMDAVRKFLSMPYDIDYDPKPVIASVQVPMLWALAGRDTEAPSKTTIAILRELQAKGAPIDLAVFPNADHGIIEFAGDKPDSPLADHTSPGYFELLADWITTRRLDRPHGTAIQTPRQTS
jgi:dienelactone hydrolase